MPGIFCAPGCPAIFSKSAREKSAWKVLFFGPCSVGSSFTASTALDIITLREEPVGHKFLSSAPNSFLCVFYLWKFSISSILQLWHFWQHLKIVLHLVLTFLDFILFYAEIFICVVWFLCFTISLVFHMCVYITTFLQNYANRYLSPVVEKSTTPLPLNAIKLFHIL